MKQETKETILRRLRQRILDVDEAKAARYQARISKMKRRLGHKPDTNVKTWTKVMESCGY